MKVLVAYYSRSGNTGKVALTLARELTADICEIKDTKNRKGFSGLLFAGKDAIRRNMTEIEYKKKDVENYDLICIGTPVWAKTMAPAIKTYIAANTFKNKKILLFCTTAFDGVRETLDDMRAGMPGAVIIKEMGLKARDIRSDSYMTTAIRDALRVLKENRGE